MKAHLVTRCGCRRTIPISAPPPREIVLPLKPPKTNEGIARRWLLEDAPLRYDPRRDGLAVRRFRLSLESLSMWEKGQTQEPWYDETTDYDPPGYDPEKRTYATPEQSEAERLTNAASDPKRTNEPVSTSRGRPKP